MPENEQVEGEIDAPENALDFIHFARHRNEQGPPPHIIRRNLEQAEQIRGQLTETEQLAREGVGLPSLPHISELTGRIMCDTPSCGEGVDVGGIEYTTDDSIPYCLCMRCSYRYIAHCEACDDSYFYGTVSRINTTTLYDEDGESVVVCEDCLDNSDGPTHCGDCGEVFWDNSGGDNEYCSECVHNNPRLHPYDYTPYFQTFRTKTECHTTPTIGIELEVEIPSLSDAHIDGIERCFNRPDTGLNLVYCKHDGSLSGGEGAEIVTHPITPRYWEETASKQYQSLLRYIKGEGGRSHNGGRCGLHIHYSRKHLTRGTLYRICKLVYGNKGPFTAIARRSSSHYCSYDYDNNTDMIQKARDRSVAGKFTAINTGRAGGTIEFRIFRGTLYYPSFAGSIGCVLSAIEYCAGNTDTRFSKYFDFLCVNVKRYPFIVNLCERRKVAPYPTKEHVRAFNRAAEIIQHKTGEYPERI